jgi:xanthine dehydrogenase YagR molybdenum-binding subunit
MWRGGRSARPPDSALGFVPPGRQGVRTKCINRTDHHRRRYQNGVSEKLVPVHMDVPAIDVIWTDIPDPHSPMGARGIGEIGISGVGAAVANAIYNAIGRRIRDLPITLDKLL